MPRSGVSGDGGNGEADQENPEEEPKAGHARGRVLFLLSRGIRLGMSSS